MLHTRRQKVESSAARFLRRYSPLHGLSSNRYPDMTFPQHWTTERTRIDVVRAEEAEVLTALFNSSSDIEELDPTFYTVDVREVLGHIEESQRCQNLERGFRMQAIKLAETNDLIGYFHFREATPKPDVVALTMFFIRPEYRSLGFGREVVDALLKLLSTDPMNHAAWGEVYLKNIQALRFWIRRGFTQVVEHKGQYVHVEGEHASVILERSFLPRAGQQAAEADR
jgi:ribosomal protein S18 acetylase RimI-like enzyme